MTPEGGLAYYPQAADTQVPLPGTQANRSFTQYPLTGQDFLRMTLAGSLGGGTVTCSARTLNQVGQVQRHVFAAAPSSNRTVGTSDFNPGDGFLLDVTARVTGGAPIFGQVWCLLELVIGQTAQQQRTVTLAAGYVTANAPVFGPVATAISSLYGDGAIRSITGTVPAAGADISETVPTGARWELISLSAALTSAVAAANRIVALVLDDGANIYFRDAPGFTQVASLTDNYNFAEGQSKLQTPGAPIIMGNVPTNVRLLAGHRIRTVTTAIQGADQWTAPQYLVREWLEL